MIALLIKPLLGWLVRLATTLLLQALGRDLRRRLPEVFALIDAQIAVAFQIGSSQVALLFSTAVQQLLARMPTEVELRILTLLFDPVAAARHALPSPEPPKP
jgi:DNA-directed RNA polymerase specialized sigma24 family protein